MQVHLVDGTYELFRHFYAVPSRVTAAGEEVAAARGVLSSMLQLLGDGATHVGVATDHVIESFRNDLWDGYKDGTGVDPDLKRQFPLLEDALRAMGLTVWAMVEDEADDALASAAVVAAADDRVERVLVCTPDKDLGQVVGGKIVQYDRRKREVRDADGVREKFGVAPTSIPDYLALVGDSADGFPGLQGWGAKGTAKVLARWGRIEDIPDDVLEWDVNAPGVRSMAARLAAERDRAMLFKTLATLRTDCEVGAVDEWRWAGPTPAFEAITQRLESPDLLRRATSLAAAR
ncbi:MAG TPA: 5'-3' exonuclease H3TH domain-containing protein [Acidimicrobiales bacterium]|nr:5'-3' exonuclease H3TH domain-containing protein [Acidimicrobiales bacterium]